MDAPIVIGSSPSAGSTMLRVVLGRDPAICTGGELAVMDRPSLFDVDRRTLHDNIESWLEDFPREFVTGHYRVFARLQEWGWQKAELIDLARQSDSWGHLLQTFFSESIRRQGARRWLEKTPGNVYGFARAREVFPDAFFVHLIRDGRDAIASLMRRDESAFLATSRWMCAVIAGLRLRRFARYVEVRYEALVSETEPSLRALCACVGQAYQPDLFHAVDQAARPPTRVDRARK
jgi:sulfotransferase family protein